MTNYDLKLEGPWNETKERLKEVNNELTDADLVYTPGKEKELLERLAQKMKKDVDDIKAWVESVSFNRGKAS
ncbi:MAG: general stress protein CsbD [Chitinophagaceae bacterium]